MKHTRWPLILEFSRMTRIEADSSDPLTWSFFFIQPYPDARIQHCPCFFFSLNAGGGELTAILIGVSPGQRIRVRLAKFLYAPRARQRFGRVFLRGVVEVVVVSIWISSRSFKTLALLPRTDESPDWHPDREREKPWMWPDCDQNVTNHARRVVTTRDLELGVNRS